MEVVHIELKEANDFVEKLHRHHYAMKTHRFSIGALLDNKLVGVAICAAPAARKTDQKFTVEVRRLCTDGTKNACSFLYSACARAARELGYFKIQTFILMEEPGTTLQAAGWEFEQYSMGGDWARASGNRDSVTHNPGPKKRYGKWLVRESKRQAIKAQLNNSTRRK